jgi:hypothetical protein
MTLLKECTFRPAINDNDGDDDDGNVIRHDTTIVERFLDAKKKVSLSFSSLLSSLSSSLA